MNNRDQLTGLLEDAFGAGYDHAREPVWGWIAAFNEFLKNFENEIDSLLERD